MFNVPVQVGEHYCSGALNIALLTASKVGFPCGANRKKANESSISYEPRQRKPTPLMGL